MPNEMIDLQGEILKALTQDINERLIAPMVKAGREAGMSDEEINLRINQAFFDAFRGLHGFPDSYRP